MERVQNAGPVLLTRPTRWGKTLLQGMLMDYYDEHTTQRKYEELFRGLHIYNHTTEGRGKYQVLSLNSGVITSERPSRCDPSPFRTIMRPSLNSLSSALPAI